MSFNLGLSPRKILYSSLAAAALVAGTSSCKKEVPLNEINIPKAEVEFAKAKKEYLQDSVQYSLRARDSLDSKDRLKSIRKLQDLYMNPYKFDLRSKIIAEKFDKNISEFDKAVEQAQLDVDIANGVIFDKSKRNYQLKKAELRWQKLELKKEKECLTKEETDEYRKLKSMITREYCMQIIEAMKDCQRTL